jgi:hypothetical protein
MTAGKRTDAADGSRHYTHPVTGDLLPSVTTILGATEGKPWLTDWSAKLAAEFCVDNAAQIASLLADDKRQAAVDLIKDQADQARKLKANAGTYVHDVQEALILWAASPDGTGGDIPLPELPENLQDAWYDDEPLEDVVDWMVRGFLNFVTAFEPEFLAAEMTVYNRDLSVAGTLDAIIVLRDVAIGRRGGLIPAPGRRLVLCLDTKTGKYLGATIHEQLASYRRMKEALLPLGEIAPMPETDGAAVLHLRPYFRDGYRLMPVAPIKDAVAWNRFRRAVELYTGRNEVGPKPGKVAYPLRADGTMPAPRLEDLDGEGYGRALAPLIKHGLADVEDVAKLTAAGLLQVKGIGAKTADMVRRMLADHDLTLADETTPIAEVA